MEVSTNPQIIGIKDLAERPPADQLLIGQVLHALAIEGPKADRRDFHGDRSDLKEFKAVRGTLALWRVKVEPRSPPDSFAPSALRETA
jgi:hypothetical protein